MNSIGRLLRFSILGESHGPAVGCLLDGVPPGLPISIADFEPDLARRRPGAFGTTPRIENDEIELLSGIHQGKTTGSPVAIIIRNSDTRSRDYDRFITHPRPGHADFTSTIKYEGYADMRGSGHFSGRITAALVAAGTVAKRLNPAINIQATIHSIAGHTVQTNPEECEKAIAQASGTGDSVGGIIGIHVSGVEAGLGEPFADSVESVLAHWLFSIPAIRGVEFGEGFQAASKHGSEHNDPIVDSSGKTASNNCGGINGGITNGNEIIVRIAVKPTSSISRPQLTWNFQTGKPEILVVEGRHDVCIATRMPVVAEAAVALALADLSLIRKAYKKENR